MAGSLRQVAGESMMLSDRCAVQRDRPLQRTRQDNETADTLHDDPTGNIWKENERKGETYVLSFASHTVEK